MQTTLDFTRKEFWQWQLRETTEYKLLERGTAGVSDLELLTTLIRNSTAAEKLFTTFGSLRAIARATMQELMQVPGIGKKSASILVSAFELAKRKNTENRDTIRIIRSRDAAEYLTPKYGDRNNEVFVVLFLSRSNHIIAEEELFVGGVSSVIVDPKIIFKKAVSYLASGIVLAHNHPSGNVQPSRADDEITARLVQAGDLLDITVIDHVIISNQDHYSYADEGRIDR